MDSEILVAALVLINSEKKLYLARRPLEKGGQWELPGGKREKGETLEQTLKREIKEELNIAVDIDLYLGSKDVTYNGKRYRLQFYLSFYKNQFIQLNEHLEGGWFSYSEAINLNISPGNLEFLVGNEILKKIV